MALAFRWFVIRDIVNMVNWAAVVSWLTFYEIFYWWFRIPVFSLNAVWTRHCGQLSLNNLLMPFHNMWELQVMYFIRLFSYYFSYFATLSLTISIFIFFFFFTRKYFFLTLKFTSPPTPLWGYTRICYFCIAFLDWLCPYRDNVTWVTQCLAQIEKYECDLQELNYDLIVSGFTYTDFDYNTKFCAEEIPNVLKKHTVQMEELNWMSTSFLNLFLMKV